MDIASPDDAHGWFDIPPTAPVQADWTYDEMRSGTVTVSSTEAMINSDRAAVPHLELGDMPLPGEIPPAVRPPRAVSGYGAMRPAVSRRRLRTASAAPLAAPLAAPPAAPPAAPLAAPTLSSVAEPEPSGRVINPFLKNDPSTKAKRLARALVSDMIAYLPAKREEGQRDGTLKQLFREEIKKSYEEYVDQVGEALAESTPFFRDALNEILAGGKIIF